MRRIFGRLVVAGLVAGGALVAAQPAQAEGCYIFNATSTGVSQRCTSYSILIFRTKTECRDSWRPTRVYWAYGPWVASGSTSRATCSAGDYRTNFDSVQISWR